MSALKQFRPIALAACALCVVGFVPVSAAPKLQFSSYIGSLSADSIGGLTVDSAGNIYVAGTTSAADFPTLNGFQVTSGGGSDVFVAKLSADGRTLLYATYLGGLGDDTANGIAVDASGSAYITGMTTSKNFPVTPEAFDRDNGRIVNCQGGDCIDGFVTKLSPSGSTLVYSTYLGGEHDDYSEAIAVDAEGQACVTGLTESFGFPQVHPFNGDKQGGSQAFVTKVAADGRTLVYSSYCGGSKGESGYGIAAGPDGSVYVAGSTYSVDFNVHNPLQAANAGGPEPLGNLDAFILKVGPAGDLVFGTYFGGTGRDVARAIAVGSDGTIYAAGSTTSDDLPRVAPTQGSRAGGTDAFLVTIRPDLTGITFSTYLGGLKDDDAFGVAVGAAGVAVAGTTDSADFPVAEPVQPACGGCVAPGFFADAFVTVFDPGPVTSTFLGGASVESASAVAATASGFVVGGSTFSANFPTTAGSYREACPCTSGSSANGFIAAIGDETVNPVNPVIDSVASLRRPFRLEIRGSGYSRETHVFIGDDATPWSPAVANETLIALGGGKQLKARFPKGVAVTVRVVNPDGGSATATFTR